MQPLPKSEAEKKLCPFARNRPSEMSKPTVHNCLTDKCLAWEKRQIVEVTTHEGVLPEGRSVDDTYGKDAKAQFKKSGDTRFYHPNGSYEIVNKITLITNDGGICQRLEPHVVAIYREN